MTLEAAHPRLRSAPAHDLRLLLFGRLVPATFFAVLGFIQFQRLISSLSGLPPHATILDLLAGPLPVGLYLLFCAVPVFIYVGRPAARARDGRALPRIAGFVGTLMLLVVGVLPQGATLYTPPSWMVGLSTTISVAAFSLAVCGLLFLRQSLSIIPEARRVVTAGPYRLVRHPLYAAEILAAFAFVLIDPVLLRALALAPFVAVQLLRARYEERILNETYPHYADYARKTNRLIPFVW